MTYAREIESFEAATARAQQALTPERAAELAGCSTSLLRKCANPMDGHALSLPRAVALDIAAARAGAGCPHLEAFSAQLVAAGVLAPGDMAPSLAARGEGLANLLRAVLPVLRGILDRLQAALDRNSVGPAPIIAGAL